MPLLEEHHYESPVDVSINDRVIIIAMMEMSRCDMGSFGSINQVCRGDIPACTQGVRCCLTSEVIPLRSLLIIPGTVPRAIACQLLDGDGTFQPQVGTVNTRCK